MKGTDRISEKNPICPNLPKFAQIWAFWAQIGPVWTENLNLAEYGHVIYRWIANVMLITDFGKLL